MMVGRMKPKPCSDSNSGKDKSLKVISVLDSAETKLEMYVTGKQRHGESANVSALMKCRQFKG
jgi:hypothetical protein